MGIKIKCGNDNDTRLVGYWVMKEGTGSSVADLSGNSNIGTITGATWTKTTGGDNCLSFDGADDYVQMADSQTLRMTTGGTISAWIYPKSIGEGTSGRIIDKTINSSGGDGYRFLTWVSNRLYFSVNGIDMYSLDNVIVYNKWHLATVSFNSSGRKIYVNGIDVTASGGSDTTLPPNIAGVVRIGNNVVDTERTFDGYIDDVRIYNAALTQAEITALYQAGLLTHNT